MVRLGTTLYAVESNHGELDRVTLNGHINRVADISFFMDHIVPTSVAVGPDGNFYLGHLSTMPYLDGKAVILKVTPQGQVSIAATGLTTVLGVAPAGPSRPPRAPHPRRVYAGCSWLLLLALAVRLGEAEGLVLVHQVPGQRQVDLVGLVIRAEVADAPAARLLVLLDSPVFVFVARDGRSLQPMPANARRCARQCAWT